MLYFNSTQLKFELFDQQFTLLLIFYKNLPVDLRWDYKNTFSLKNFAENVFFLNSNLNFLTTNFYYSIFYKNLKNVSVELRWCMSDSWNSALYKCKKNNRGHPVSTWRPRVELQKYLQYQNSTNCDTLRFPRPNLQSYFLLVSTEFYRIVKCIGLDVMNLWRHICNEPFLVYIF